MEKQLLPLLVAAMAAVLVVAAAATIGQPAEAADPAPSLLCGMTQEGLEACQPAATAKKAVPSPACCAALAGADLPCLCKFKNKNRDLLKSLKIDPSLATQLPTKCHLTPPPVC